MSGKLQPPPGLHIYARNGMPLYDPYTGMPLYKFHPETHERLLSYSEFLEQQAHKYRAVEGRVDRDGRVYTDGSGPSGLTGGVTHVPTAQVRLFIFAFDAESDIKGYFSRLSTPQILFTQAAAPNPGITSPPGPAPIGGNQGPPGPPPRPQPDMVPSKPVAAPVAAPMPQQARVAGDMNRGPASGGPHAPPGPTAPPISANSLGSHTTKSIADQLALNKKAVTKPISAPPNPSALEELDNVIAAQLVATKANEVDQFDVSESQNDSN